MPTRSARNGVRRLPMPKPTTAAVAPEKTLTRRRPVRNQIVMSRLTVAKSRSAAALWR
jgi:hypothetical protein